MFFLLSFSICFLEDIYILHMSSNYFHFLTVITVSVTQSCWDPMDLPVKRTLQARILAWVAIHYSKGSSQHRGSSQSYLSLLLWRQNSLPFKPSGKPYRQSKQLSFITHLLSAKSYGRTFIDTIFISCNSCMRMRLFIS